MQTTSTGTPQSQPIEGELLATVTTPPASFLAPHPTLPARAEQLRVYQPTEGGYLVTRLVKPQAGEVAGPAVIVACGDAEAIAAKLGQGPLARALYHLADLPVAYRRDEDGNLRLDVNTIRCYVWSGLAGGIHESLRALVDEDPLESLHRMWWSQALGRTSPGDFKSTTALRRFLARQRSSGPDVPDFVERSCLWTWRRWREAEAVRLVPACVFGEEGGA